MNLITQIKQTKREIQPILEKRIKEFKKLKKARKEKIFEELSFCLLTANFTAEGGLRIQKEISNGFLKYPKNKLKKELKQLGHRFPNTRAEYIFEARDKLDDLMKLLKTQSDSKQIREWLVKNIKGLGFKESSHFLRNVGYEDLAIIDFHIIDILAKNKLIKKPKTKSLSKKKYLEIEKQLEKISKKTNIPLGELDLILWYMETGKVLK